MEKVFFEISPEYLTMNGYEKDVNLYFKHRKGMDSVCVIHAIKNNVFIASVYKSEQSFNRIIKSGNDLYLFEIVTGFSVPTEKQYCDWVD